MDPIAGKDWEARDVPSPVTLMTLTDGTGASPQDMYYALMEMGIEDFRRAESAVSAMDLLRKGGMYDLMEADIDDACKAITSGKLDDAFDRAIKSMASALTHVSNAISKSESRDKDEKDDDEDGDEDGDAKKKGAPEDIPVPDKADDAEKNEASDEPEADPASEPAPIADAMPRIDMAALMAKPETKVEIDPELIMRALKLLQSIGAVC